MSKIEKGMHAVHEKARNEGNGEMTSSAATTASSVVPICFASINLVTEGSPAELDGLRVGDREDIGHI
jgi:hypothetical protein